MDGVTENYSKLMTSNWSTYTSCTEEKSITSLRIRRALRLENLRVYAAETRSLEPLEQREVRLETDRMRTTQRPVHLNHQDNGKQNQ